MGPHGLLCSRLKYQQIQELSTQDTDLSSLLNAQAGFERTDCLSQARVSAGGNVPCEPSRSQRFTGGSTVQQG